MRKHFGPDVPSVRELEKRIAIILVNSHISLNGIKPTIPAAVDVGGLHVYDEGLTLLPVIPGHSFCVYYISASGKSFSTFPFFSSLFLVFSSRCSPKS